MEENQVLFKEIQKFRSIVLWVFLLALAGFLLYGVVQQVMFDIPFGNNPASDIGLVTMFLVFGIGFSALFYFSKLTTEVRKDGVYYRFKPFHIRWNKIVLRDVKKYEIRKYRPLKEYGGYGIRYGLKGRAYNVSGVMGIQFELNNGKRILIGTQAADNFKEAIDKIREGVR